MKMTTEEAFFKGRKGHGFCNSASPSVAER